MVRPVEFSRRAERNLTEIYHYIAGESGQNRADTVVSGLVSACRALEQFSERGTLRPDLYPGLRLIGHRRFAPIAFVVEIERVIDHGVFWKGRDLERAFSKAK